jgi:hypothetical protein
MISPGCTFFLPAALAKIFSVIFIIFALPFELT